MPNIHLIRSIKELPNSGLYHNDHDDSRHVKGNGILIKFNSSLDVFKNDKQIGRIYTNGNSKDTENFTYVCNENGDIFDTSIPCRNWHWTAIENAEIKIALYLLNINQ